MQVLDVSAASAVSGGVDGMHPPQGPQGPHFPLPPGAPPPGAHPLWDPTMDGPWVAPGFWTAPARLSPTTVGLGIAAFAGGYYVGTQIEARWGVGSALGDWVGSSLGDLGIVW